MYFNVIHFTLGMIEGTLPETKLDCLATCHVTLVFQTFKIFLCIGNNFAELLSIYNMRTASKNMSLLVAEASLIISCTRLICTFDLL